MPTDFKVVVGRDLSSPIEYVLIGKRFICLILFFVSGTLLQMWRVLRMNFY